MHSSHAPAVACIKQVILAIAMIYNLNLCSSCIYMHVVIMWLEGAFHLLRLIH